MDQCTWKTVGAPTWKRACGQWVSQGDNETRGLRREAAGEMGLKLLGGGEVELRVRVEDLVPRWSAHRRREEYGKDKHQRARRKKSFRKRRNQILT